jgi:hypothetical protein
MTAPVAFGKSAKVSVLIGPVKKTPYLKNLQYAVKKMSKPEVVQQKVLI